MHHQGIIYGVAFDLSSLRRIDSYVSVVAPRRLVSNTLLVIRNPRYNLLIFEMNRELGEGFGFRWFSGVRKSPLGYFGRCLGPEM